MFYHAAHSRNPWIVRKEETKPMNNANKRLLALILALCMLILSVPAAMAEDASATVYFTLSSDGVPVVGNDSNSTVLSRVKVTVPYFDLALYGFQQYYRYGTDGDFGRYTNNTLVEKPSVFHLYIYMLERFYQGLPEYQCGKGNLNKELYKEARDAAGNIVNPGGLRALSVSGGAMSLYMTNFWGHDENLMYFVDHQYPLMSPGIGATSDYILLEDGMCVDVAMFTNWNFYHSGGFMYFDQDNYNVTAGEEQTISLWRTLTGSSVQGEYSIGVVANGMVVSLWNEDMTYCYEENVGVTGADGVEGQITYTFTEPGTYMLLAEDPNKGTKNSANAPAAAVVNVKEETVGLESIAFDTDAYSIEYGDTWQLVPVVEPAEATNVTYSWTSSNPNAVSVSSVGILKGEGEGITTITCTATDGTTTKTAECTVEVGAVIDVTGVAFKKNTITVAEGRQVQLEYNVLPANANNKSVVFRTSECPDFDVNYTDEEHTTAKVDHLGVLTAKKEGEITVTVRTNEGHFTDEITVKVVPQEMGDVSGDGSINAKDVNMALRYAAKMSVDGGDVTWADVSGDGKVNAKDVNLLLRFSAKLIDSFN